MSKPVYTTVAGIPNTIHAPINLNPGEGGDVGSDTPSKTDVRTLAYPPSAVIDAAKALYFDKEDSDWEDMLVWFGSRFVRGANAFKNWGARIQATYPGKQVIGFNVNGVHPNNQTQAHWDSVTVRMAALASTVFPAYHIVSQCMYYNSPNRLNPGVVWNDFIKRSHDVMDNVLRFSHPRPLRMSCISDREFRPVFDTSGNIINEEAAMVTDKILLEQWVIDFTRGDGVMVFDVGKHFDSHAGVNTTQAQSNQDRLYRLVFLARDIAEGLKTMPAFDAAGKIAA